MRLLSPVGPPHDFDKACRSLARVDKLPESSCEVDKPSRTLARGRRGQQTPRASAPGPSKICSALFLLDLLCSALFLRDLLCSALFKVCFWLFLLCSTCLRSALPVSALLCSACFSPTKALEVLSQRSLLFYWSIDGLVMIACSYRGHQLICSDCFMLPLLPLLYWSGCSCWFLLNESILL